MNTTQPVPFQSEQKSWVRRHLGATLLLLLVVLGVAGYLIGLGYQAGTRGDADGKMRDAAIAAYAAQLSKDTHGGIVIPNNRQVQYDWSIDMHTLSLDGIQVGSCSAEGTFNPVPRRPAGVSQIGELYLTVPSVNRWAQSAKVSVRDPSFYQKLMASALAQCVAGDKRFSKNTDK